MKKGMALGLFLMAVGALVFGQYTTARRLPGALTGVFVIGAGLAILQTAANPYISILGPIEGAAQRIAVMGICNKVAGILAPLVLGAVVMHGMGDLAAQVAAADAATQGGAAQRVRLAHPRPVHGDGGAARAAGGRHRVLAAAGDPRRRSHRRRPAGNGGKTASSSSRTCGWVRCASLSTSASR